MAQTLQKALESEQPNEKPVQYKIHGVDVSVIPSDRDFVQKLFDSMAEIPTGRKALADMAKFKTKFFLESDLGSAGGYFSPDKNIIVMAKTLGMDFMEFSTVHEARHALQHQQGRHLVESQHLDYASQLMINRATEADAQTQAIQACQEWKAIGHDAPLKRFYKHYPEIVDAYDKRHSLSDAFKGWYNEERICAAYEKGYDVEPRLANMTGMVSQKPYVSVKPKDILAFCGGDRVEDVEEFLLSKQANQIHLSTKTAVELYDLSQTARSGVHDMSIEKIPLRDLKDNAAGTMYAAKNMKEIEELLDAKIKTPSPRRKTVYGAVKTVMDQVDAIERAASKGEKIPQAEEKLKEAKRSFASVVSGKSVQELASVLMARRTQTSRR